MYAVVCFLLLMLLSACARRDQVVLLDKSGKGHTLVQIQTEKRTETLTQPLQAAFLNEKSIEKAVITRDDVDKYYGSIREHLPGPSHRYTVYFATGSRELNAEAEHTIAVILLDVKGRGASEVQVTGHTDSVGTVESNDLLSAERARTIGDLLLSKGLKTGLLRIIGRGERELKIPTGDETAEERNRRVEILVR
jgi:outer membrane protein OmpA-like peptidoglycan-associated protein